MKSTGELAIARHGDCLTDRIVVDFQSIPKHIVEDLAAATVASVKAFLRQPGGSEYLEARRAAKIAEKAVGGSFQTFSEWALENGYSE